jgi:uncharacterized protein with HEPN domain
MVEEVAGIRALLQVVSFETYRTTWSLRRATERGLEIVSEASRSIPAELQGLHPDIPWRQIADLGNLLRHEYQHVDPLMEHRRAVLEAVGRGNSNALGASR